MPPPSAPPTPPDRASSARHGLDGFPAGSFVIAGVAGDPGDDATLRAASALARSLEGELEAVHVEPGPSGVVEAERELARRSDLLDARFVVIGCRQSGNGAARGPAGTTTRGMLADLHRPLWVQRGPWTPPERIVAAIDDPTRDAGVLAVGYELARRLRATLVVLHCRDLVRPALGIDDRAGFEGWLERELTALGGREGLDVQLLHVSGPPVRALAGPLERADLVVLGRGRRPGLGRVLHGAVSSRRGPFVVVPAEPL